MNAIKRVLVKKLWGALTVDWKINNQVVVLAGGNGSGKSTILRSVAFILKENKVPNRYAGLFEDITIDASDLKHIEANFFGCDLRGASKNEIFCDLIDEAFEKSHKKIIRNSDNEMSFMLANGFILNFDQMSAGEQELIKLYARAIGLGVNDAYILDEPETSLHIDWQEDLIENLMQLAPNAQYIISTHSPAMILNGWTQNVIQIEQLFL